MGTVLYEASYRTEMGIPIAGLLLAACIWVLIHNIREFRDKKQHNKKFEKYPHYPKEALGEQVVGIILSALSIPLMIFCFIIVLTSQFDMHKNIITAYRNGQYETVEGYVENFEPKNSDNPVECFTINGIPFEYSDQHAVQGYDTPALKGGVITGNGQHLKIGYIYYGNGWNRNVIVQIEELSE